MSTDSLSAAIDDLRSSATPLASRGVTFGVPFFPNTFMLAYALSRLGCKPAYLNWNRSPLAIEPPSGDEHRPVGTGIGRLRVGIFTDRMVAEEEARGKWSLLSKEHITTFRPAYIYLVRHFHFWEGFDDVRLDAASFGHLVDGFQRIVLFGDTNEQTKALAKVFERWIGTQPKVEAICADEWLPVSQRERGLDLRMFYMSPARRTALDRTSDCYLRMKLDDSALKDLLVDFRTNVTVWQVKGIDGNSVVEEEARGFTTAAKRYLTEVFRIARMARRLSGADGNIGLRRVHPETQNARRSLVSAWETYSDMAGATFPTAVPESSADFAALLADHHWAEES
jgi:hypothetical protein